MFTISHNIFLRANYIRKPTHYQLCCLYTGNRTFRFPDNFCFMNHPSIRMIHFCITGYLVNQRQVRTRDLQITIRTSYQPHHAHAHRSYLQHTYNDAPHSPIYSPTLANVQHVRWLNICSTLSAPSYYCSYCSHNRSKISTTPIMTIIAYHHLLMNTIGAIHNTRLASLLDSHVWTSVGPIATWPTVC